MRVQWLGLTDYVSSVKYQTKLAAQFKETILGLEHPSTITMGKRADPLKDIKASVRVLKEKNISIVGVDRGGQATFHNPGQLVIYPIINLKERGVRVRDYVHLLEDVTKRFLKDHGITACCRGEEPGLYTLTGKIGFVGVRITSGMTTHGISLNVTNDLQEFAYIRSCGKEGEQFSKMSEFMNPPPLESLFFLWCEYFQTGLGLTMDVNRPIVELPF